jgi:hypothetical protein
MTAQIVSEQGAPTELDELRLYTPDEVCAMTGESPFTLRRLAKQGKITSRRGKRDMLLFNAGDIRSLHALYGANAADRIEADAEPEEETPFNFTSRGKAIARNKAS